MKLIVNKNRTTTAVGTWGTKNENDYEILEFEFPEELEEYNKRIVYYLDNERVWDIITDNKVYITNAVTQYEKVKAYVWLTKENTEREADTDFRSKLFEMKFYDNDNASGITPTPEQVDGFNTMLTAMNRKIDEVNALEQTIETAEAERQENENTRISNESTRQSNESTRQTNEQTRQSQEAERERKTSEAIADIQDKTAEYNANAEAKTNEFNQNATQKTNEFNSNYTQKVNDFNTNATTQETDFNSNASSKTSAFNSNTETKTNAFNTNATNKTNVFNSNVSEKTTAFDNNASTKTSEFNTNAESKTSVFNDNATQKTTNFDNNASEKTDEFNTNAQNKIDEYDEHIVDYQAQIDELQEEVEELSENMPWDETTQATEISVNDAAKYSRNKLQLFGNTEQASYQGYNLININSAYPLNNISGRVNITTINDTLEVEAISDGTWRIAEIVIDNLEVNNTYTVAWKNAQNTSETTASIGVFTMAGGQIFLRNLMDQTYFTFTATENSVKFRLGYTKKCTTGDTVTIENLIMYSGTEEKLYEPYVGGQPSPNPDYPQDIHVFTGNNSVVVQGINIFDGILENGTVDYSTGVNAISTGGIVRSKNYIPISSAYKIIAKTPFSSPHIIGFRYYDKDYNYIGRGSVNLTNYATATPNNSLDNTKTVAYMRFIDSSANEDITEEFCIRTDSSTDYVPYYHADYPINLGNIELCKIGDYQDYLYKENGNWYESKRINKYKLTSGFIDTGAIKNNVYRILTYQNSKTITPALNEKNTILTACTHFVSLTRSQSDAGNLNGIALLNTSGFMINLTKGSDLSSVSAFKTFVDNNDVIIYYILAIPIITQITDTTLISQLDEIYEHLQLVKGTNNITVTAEDLAPYMKLTYMQDLPSKLDNLDSRLALLE